MKLLPLFLLMALPALVQAQFTYVTNYTYTKNSGSITTNGSITITGYIGNPEVLIIPSTTNGWPVTTIGTNAFYDCTNLTSITISTNVTSIGRDAFYDCFSLTNVTIPDSVISIGLAAFYNNNRLASVTIPGSITSFGEYAFEDCYGLTSVTISNGVTSIGWEAFAFCDRLTNVSIPASVTNIGLGAFSFCINMINISVDAANPAYVSTIGVLFDKSGDTLIQYPAGLAFPFYTIPNSVTSIEQGAFDGCTSLKNVIVPNSVTNIAAEAFFDCTSLTSITVPYSVTSIGGSTFYYCINLTNISVAAANPVYSSTNGVLFDKAEDTLISYPDGLTNGTYSIPNTVTNIGRGAFEQCSLTSVLIPNSVTSIGESAFYACSSLNSIIIPSCVTSVGAEAFAYCNDLTSVYFLGNAPSDGGDVFYYDPVSIYYLLGTSNWGTTFGSAATVLWNPQAQTGDGSLGVQNNQFGFNITGTTNIPILIEASTNLADGDWTPLQSCVVTNGNIYFSDPQWTNYPGRYYRISAP